MKNQQIFYSGDEVTLKSPRAYGFKPLETKFFVKTHRAGNVHIVWSRNGIKDTIWVDEREVELVVE